MRILMLACLMFLAACAASQNGSEIKNSDFKAAEPPPQLSVEETKPAPAQDVVAVEKAAVGKPGEVDFSCNTDNDCKIKDVGSCCGYRPACVNKDSKTFPAEVKAECVKKDMMSTCGFPSISSCTCTNNKCEGVSSGVGEEVIQ